MKVNTGPSIYIPTDKNIFDALLHKKVTFKELQKFLVHRGILISEKLDKKEIAKIVSQLTFDYHDYTRLKELLENTNRKEKSTTTTLKVESTADEITALCNKIAKNNIDNDDSYKVVKRNNSTLLIISYTDIDFTKTELRQRTSKTCEIVLEMSNNELLIHQPATNKGKEVVSIIKSALEEDKEIELVEEKISLETITSPEDRSNFFNNLINAIDGYNLEDVTSIDVHHTIDNLELDDEEHSDEELIGFIKKAALSGDGVLLSPEFQQLHKKGFFISKIVWKSKDMIFRGDIVEFEALFGNASSCTDFKYLVRGIYNFSDRTGKHNVTKRRASALELGILNKKLVDASKSSYLKLLAKNDETSL